jgi:hypothetical protein
VALYCKNLLEYATQNSRQPDSLAGVLGVTALGFYDKAFSAMNAPDDADEPRWSGGSFRLFALIQEDLDRFRRGYRKVILSATLSAIRASPA